VRLPRAYLGVLRDQKGGYLRLCEHPRGRSLIDWIAGIGPRFTSLHRMYRRYIDDVKPYMEEEGITTPKRIDDLVPFCGDGYYYYCFDYRLRGRKREPRIAYIDVETFNVDLVVAPDFGTFLGELRVGTQKPMYGLMTHGRPASVAAALSKATGLRFEEIDDELWGYHLFQAKISRRDEYAYLSANRTRRGFIRTDDTEYKKLRKRMREIVDRYPQHPDCGYLLSCKSFETAAGRRLVRALAKLPFGARALPPDA
jgi:SMI1/KNR4 family protein SUKH-1